MIRAGGEPPLVSWLSGLCEAKQSGCEILTAPGQSVELRPVGSLIRSRRVLFNSNSYLSDAPSSTGRISSNLQEGVSL